MTVAGVHVAAGVIYVAIGDPDPSCSSGLRLRGTSPSKVELAVGLSEAAQLADVLSRVSQDFRTHDVTQVGIMHTRLHANWVYTAAFTRSSLITCVLLAAQENGLLSRIVKPEAAARALGVPVAGLRDLPSQGFGLDDQPRYWRAGLSEASSAAAAMVH